jgi:hypothetical protein
VVLSEHLFQGSSRKEKQVAAEINRTVLLPLTASLGIRVSRHLLLGSKMGGWRPLDPW